MSIVRKLRIEVVILCLVLCACEADEATERERLISKHPPLEAWFAFRSALEDADYVTAASHICDNWLNTKRFDTNSDSAMKDLREKTLEVKMIRGGLRMDFAGGEVVESTDTSFVIDVPYPVQGVEEQRRFWNRIGETEELERLDAASPEELREFEDRLKSRPHRLRFRRLDGQWYFLPTGW